MSFAPSLPSSYVKSGIKNDPGQPHWLFLIMAVVISMAVAAKAHSEGFLVAQKKGDTVGRKAAQKYFKKDAKPEGAEEGGESSESKENVNTDHFMAIHIGTFFNDESFSWGNTRNVDGAGDFGFGVTYRMGEWAKSMDLLFRGEWLSYELPEGKPSKLSFLSMVQFPEASSGFPLYFGLGAGLGIFTKQISGESDVSLDYQVVGGARWFILYNSVGFVSEVGLKNHFHLFSSGQFNSLFFSVGSVFTF